MLRLLDPERDGPALHAIFGDEACCKYLGDPATKNTEETIRLLKKWTDGTEDTSWAIVESADGSALGRATLLPRGREIWEIGIMLAPRAQGRGLAATSLAQIIDDAFEKRGARRVFADTDQDNLSCIRLFERLGFRREGLLRGNWHTHLGVRDSVILGLLWSDPRPWRR